MTKSDEIIQVEIQKLLDDIISAYENSGRKVTGNFADGLEAVYEPNKATIRGFVYLAGRGETKNGSTPGKVLPRIKEWMEDVGLADKIRNKAKTERARINNVNGLAYVITKNIHEKGTDSDKWYNVYEEVITVDRISSIISKVAEININKLLTDIRAELEILQTTY